MNDQSTPNTRRLAVIIGLFLLLTIALLFFARDVIRELVVLPLSYLFWLIGILIDSTPQIFFWLALLVIAFLLASRSLSRKRKILTMYPPGYTVPDDPISTGRVNYWMGKEDLLRGRQGGFYSRSFHSALGRLLLDLLMYRYRLAPRQVEKAVREGTLDLPADIRAYVLESLSPPEPARRFFFLNLLDSIVGAVRDWIDQIQAGNLRWGGLSKARQPGGGRMDKRVARDDPRVKRVLTYIEEELEVPHDKSSR